MVHSCKIKPFLVYFFIVFYVEYSEGVICTDNGKVDYNMSDPWRKEDFPNPLKEPVKCGRRTNKQTFICDPDNILSKQEADSLDEQIGKTLSNTTCVCGQVCEESDAGFSIAIAMVNRIHHTEEFLTEADKLKITEKFSRHLRTSSWVFGQCDNDAVIIINKEFNKAWTSTGDVFNEHLSDWCVNHIYKEHRFLIKDGNYSYALSSMIKNYRDVLQGNLYCKEGVRPGTVIFFLAMCLFASCTLIAFASFLKQRFHICEDEPVKVHVEEMP